jgi:hypothetical protein
MPCVFEVVICSMIEGIVALRQANRGYSIMSSGCACVVFAIWTFEVVDGCQMAFFCRLAPWVALQTFAALRGIVTKKQSTVRKSWYNIFCTLVLGIVCRIFDDLQWAKTIVYQVLQFSHPTGRPGHLHRHALQRRRFCCRFRPRDCVRCENQTFNENIVLLECKDGHVLDENDPNT